jgi:hypothetical protein
MPGDAEVTALSIDVECGAAYAHYVVAFKRPPKAPRPPLIELGSDAFIDRVRTYDWAKLCELDDDPTTTPTTPPQAGQTLTFKVPLPLNPSFTTAKPSR